MNEEKIEVEELEEDREMTAATQGTLPFGFSHKLTVDGKAYTKIPKLAVWNWFGLKKGE